ncbi:unnamed protein product [Rotaria sp. Silwood2]|nr:unnamed protein product [Rotaria sp. Silwood2]
MDSNSNKTIAKSVRFWLLAVVNSLSLICSLFHLYHLLTKRVLQGALTNHSIILLAILASERKDDELQTLFYKDLNDLSTDFPSEYIECFLQKQYNSKLYPELLKNLINFTGVRLSKFNTELELPIDTTDLDDLNDSEYIVLPEFYLTDCYGMFLVAIIVVGCSSVALNLLPNYKSNIRSADQLLCLDAMSAFASNDHLIEAC